MAPVAPASTTIASLPVALACTRPTENKEAPASLMPPGNDPVQGHCMRP